MSPILLNLNMPSLIRGPLRTRLLLIGIPRRTTLSRRPPRTNTLIGRTHVQRPVLALLTFLLRCLEFALRSGVGWIERRVVVSDLVVGGGLADLAPLGVQRLPVEVLRRGGVVFLEMRGRAEGAVCCCWCGWCVQAWYGMEGAGCSGGLLAAGDEVLPHGLCSLGWYAKGWREVLERMDDDCELGVWSRLRKYRELISLQ